ncbi:hypothetical protein [Clostridioides difficile]|uniref:hypothetical protein n=1 Tax=Clostridioides difficile TaxID=1496 RepID=UPI000B0F21C7|nr:hypothetical protein [Clostridioides difficile]
MFVAGRNLTDFYPITAGLGLVGYNNGAGTVYQPLIGAMTLIVILILTTILLVFTPNYDKVMTISKKKGIKHKKYSHK